MNWQHLNTRVPQTVDELRSLLLENRSISAEEAESFFTPPHPQELSPAELGIDPEQLDLAVAAIEEAIRDQKRIVIFGDYDADGICATAVLWLALKSIGCVAQPFIPKRDVHGYGLSVGAVKEVIESHHSDMIITVDNGIVAHQAAQFVLDAGIELLITDHHQPERGKEGEQLFPPATAVVHSTQLCGTTVAWMVARELTDATEELLDLCGIATIADQVPLVHANRSFAYSGIAALRTTTRPGIIALLAEAQVEQATVSEGTIGYGLAPRINAMGRLAHGMDALRLLCTGQAETAGKLARQLSHTNTERQDITQEQFEVAVAQVQLQTTESISIAWSDSFHEGVIGLIAGRLVEQFSRPAVVISTSSAILKGSARSLKGINITDLLRSVREELAEVGGHPMAGGFSVKPGRLEEFKVKLFAAAQVNITAAQLEPALLLECELPAALIKKETVLSIEQCAPFGAANPQPLFSMPKSVVRSVQQIGKEYQHLKLRLELLETGQLIEAVWWRAGKNHAQYQPETVVTIAGKLELSRWKNRESLQFVVSDLHTVEVAAE